MMTSLNDIEGQLSKKKDELYQKGVELERKLDQMQKQHDDLGKQLYEAGFKSDHGLDPHRRLHSGLKWLGSHEKQPSYIQGNQTIRGLSGRREANGYSKG